MGTRPRINSATLAWMSSLVIHLIAANVLCLLLLPLYLGHRGCLTLELSTVDDASQLDLAFELPAVEIDIPSNSLPDAALDVQLQSAEWRIDDSRGTRGGSAGGDAGQQSAARASYFGVTASGDRFVYVLDMSTSMEESTGDSIRSTRFEEALNELIRSVDALNPNQSFYVFLFCYKTRRIFDDRAAMPQMIPATAENKARLRKWLARIRCGAGTDPRSSLHSALKMRPNAIFLLSDGEFNGRKNGRRCGPLAGNPSAIEIVKDQNRGNCPIHALSLDKDDNRSEMNALARVSGGSYQLISAPGMNDEQRRLERHASWLLRTVQRLEQVGQVDLARQRYGIIARHYETTAAAAEARLRIQRLRSSQQRSKEAVPAHNM